MIALLITEDICVGEKEDMYNGYMEKYSNNRDRVSDNIIKAEYEINPTDFLEGDELRDLDNFLHDTIFTQYENERFEIDSLDYKIVLDIEERLI